MLRRRVTRRRRTIPILLGLLAVGVAAWIVLRPAPAPPPVVSHPTPQQVARVQTHLVGLQKTASSPGPGVRTLRLSENDLNVFLAGSLSARSLLASRGVQSVQIVLQEPSQMIVYASVRVRDALQNVQIEGTLAADPKTGLRFTASSAQVGSLPLPASIVTAEANKQASQISDQFSRQLPLSIQSVTVQRKDLVIVGLPLSRSSPQSGSPDRH